MEEMFVSRGMRFRKDRRILRAHVTTLFARFSPLFSQATVDFQNQDDDIYLAKILVAAGTEDVAVS